MTPRITRPRAAIAGGTAFVVVAAVAVSLTLAHGGSAASPAASRPDAQGTAERLVLHRPGRRGLHRDRRLPGVRRG